MICWFNDGIMGVWWVIVLVLRGLLLVGKVFLYPLNNC